MRQAGAGGAPVQSIRGWKGWGWVAVLALAASACTQQRAEPVPQAQAHPPRQPVAEAHAPPRITSTFQSELSAHAGRPVTLRVVASDPQARSLIIHWTSNTGALSQPVHEAAQSEVEWTPPPCATTDTVHSITATVTNAVGLTAVTTFTVSGETTCLAGRGGTSRTRLLSLHSDSMAWNAR